MWQVEVSHKSEMAGPFNRGDTIINKHFSFIVNLWQIFYQKYHQSVKQFGSRSDATVCRA